MITIALATGPAPIILAAINGGAAIKQLIILLVVGIVLINFLLTLVGYPLITF